MILAGHGCSRWKPSEVLLGRPSLAPRLGPAELCRDRDEGDTVGGEPHPADHEPEHGDDCGKHDGEFGGDRTSLVAQELTRAHSLARAERLLDEPDEHRADLGGLQDCHEEPRKRDRREDDDGVLRSDGPAFFRTEAAQGPEEASPA